MNSRSSAEINAEIYNYSPELFESVKSAVQTLATKSASTSVHEKNKIKLNEAVNKVLLESISTDSLDHNAMWQAIWPRIVYAYKTSSVATAEIASMKALIPIFQDLENFDPNVYVFDKSEWQEFTNYWKERYPNKSHKSKWLSFASQEADWNPSEFFANRKTSFAVWKMLTKDPIEFPGLRFSSKGDKVEKYLTVAKFLHSHKASGEKNPLNLYTGGASFSFQHLKGDAWLTERKKLKEVRQRFEVQLGKLTALHTMMDLGLKTIKPDRVMTYLFSQLGWLQTLPKDLAKDEVLDKYLNSSVVDEMTVRADVFAASLSNAGFEQAHRLLDIWFVKFGQEPEPNFGITVNLQKSGPSIQLIFNQVLQNSKDRNLITEQEAASFWPTSEFRKLSISGKSENASRKRLKIIMTPEERDRKFFLQWKEGHKNRPDIYPAGNPGIDNASKDQILKKIERGVDPEEAFLSVLVPDEDD